MAHFAKIDKVTNVVVDVNVVNNDDIQNLPFPESEPIGIEFLTPWSDEQTYWKQTSYNRNFRKNYGGIGMIYAEEIDAFIPPQPFKSWVLNVETGLWDAPVARPPCKDGNCIFDWDEEQLVWVRLNNESK